MRKISIMLLAGMLFLCACSNQNTMPQEITSSQKESSVISSSIVSSEQSADNQQSGNDKPMSDEQVFAIFKGLAEKGKTVIYWYLGDVYDANDNGLAIELDGSELENLDLDNPYRKVGKFSTIAEIEAATEEVFTQEFCTAFLYDNAFTDLSGGDRPLYNEIDGVLHRNIYSGGFGWPFQLTDQYDIALQTEELIVLTVKCNVLDREHWYNCMMKKENGGWKLEKLYNYSPYSEYEDLATPVLSSPIAAFDWGKITDLEPENLISYYIYQFCSDLGSEYNDANPYTVPAGEAVENLSRHFDGITKEMMIKAAKK